MLLLRAEADAPPILPFTSDHAALRRAIQSAQPSSATADIPRALEMARRPSPVRVAAFWLMSAPACSMKSRRDNSRNFAQRWKRPRIPSSSRNFWCASADDGATLENRGITRLSLRRDAAQPDRWHLLTQLKNYGDTKADVALKLSVNGQPLGQRQIALAPGELANTENEFVWDQGGLLQAEIISHRRTGRGQSRHRHAAHFPHRPRCAICEPKFSFRRQSAFGAVRESVRAGANPAAGDGRKRHA